jgi:hypothetical protein
MVALLRFTTATLPPLQHVPAADASRRPLRALKNYTCSREKCDHEVLDALGGLLQPYIHDPMRSTALDVWTHWTAGLPWRAVEAGSTICAAGPPQDAVLTGSR